MNTFGRKLLTIAICAGVSALALTGCGKKKIDKTEVVATVDGTEVTYGELNFYLRYQQAGMENTFGALFGDASSLWTQDLTGSGEPYGDTLKETVMHDYQDMVVLEKHMSDYDAELTDEEKTAAQEAAKAFIEANSEDTLETMTADEETVTRVLTLMAIRSKMEPLIEADADTEVSDDEAAQKTIQYTLYSTADTTDDEGNTVERTEEEIAQIKQEAQDVIDAVKGGKTLEDAAKEDNEDQTVTTYSYGEDEDVLTDVVKEAADAMTEDGQVTEEPLEGENGYYVVQMQSLFDEEATEEKKEEIIEDRKEELFEEVVEGWKEEKVVINEDLWSSVAFDVTFTAPETEATTEEVTSETTTEVASETSSESEVTSESEITSEVASETETTSETVTESETETTSETTAETETESETK